MMYLDYVATYPEIWYEMLTLHREVNDMDDCHLVDEVSAIYTDEDDIENILTRYYTDGTLSMENKSKLIAFYLLCFGSLYLED